MWRFRWQEIIEKTVRVLRAEMGLKGAVDVDKVIGMVIGSDKSRAVSGDSGGGGSGQPAPSSHRQ